MTYSRNDDEILRRRRERLYVEVTRIGVSSAEIADWYAEAFPGSSVIRLSAAYDSATGVLKTTWLAATAEEAALMKVFWG